MFYSPHWVELLRRPTYAETFLLLKNTHKRDIKTKTWTEILVRILPCCIILTVIKTAVFLLCLTVTVILKWICLQRIYCLVGNHHTGKNAHVVTQHSLVWSAFFPTTLISEEFWLAAQRVWRMQHDSTVSLRHSSTLQLVFLRTHTIADDIFVFVLVQVAVI